MTPTSKSMIRHAAVSDAELLAELGARTFSETYGGDNTREDMAAYLAASFSPLLQAAELTNPLSIFLIAEISNVAVGYAKLHAGLHAGGASEGAEGEKPIELVRLYVSQEWHGRGVGEALMRACIDEARQAGHRTLWLGVWEHNNRAQAFYRKWEFREVGKQIFQLGSDPQTDIIMERAI